MLIFALCLHGEVIDVKRHNDCLRSDACLVDIILVNRVFLDCWGKPAARASVLTFHNPELHLH